MEPRGDGQQYGPDGCGQGDGGESQPLRDGQPGAPREQSVHPLRGLRQAGRTGAEHPAVQVEFGQREGGGVPAVSAGGPVVGGQLDQLRHLVPEGAEDADAGEAGGECLGELLERPS